MMNQEELVSNQNKIWDNWLESVEVTGKELTEWEDNFIKSLRNQRTADRKYTINNIPGFIFSEKQADILERIYANKTP